MSDIVERLRLRGQPIHMGDGSAFCDGLANEAAEEIERLRANVTTLLEATEAVIDWDHGLKNKSLPQSIYCKILDARLKADAPTKVETP